MCQRGFAPFTWTVLAAFCSIQDGRRDTIFFSRSKFILFDKLLKLNFKNLQGRECRFATRTLKFFKIFKHRCYTGRPKNISEILPRELVKARKLARQVTLPEVEMDTYEWRKLTDEHAGIRTHEGGKKLSSRNEDHYDGQLLSFCSHQFQKGSRIVSQALSKYSIPTGDLYLGWRLRKMAEEEKLMIQGDQNKTMKDFEVKLPGENDTVGVP